MVIDKIIVPWEEIHTTVESIHSTTEANDVGDIAIIGISRGGLIPAVLLSQLKNNSSVYTVGIKSYSGNKRNKDFVYQTPSIETLKEYKTLYLVDDICDTGLTFKHLTEKYFTELNLKTISLFYRSNSLYSPDYYGTKLLDESWVVFPWEKE
jgi:xanthine phosphoribosyltransferase